ncbi:glycoside hydrolase family 2 protein [Eubacterium oxidoreducens]|uniref:Beta-galactosidase n=1 Tax=Eubacterium oxidoreducens TaxID=1732 RepID=A0A1G6AWY9_EUBOX|nr:glycoside hydrolase family 2 TIM barrel-domain containing protein [Eubacterium oxidoreducens]SDB12875.1 beta-galactosidase [Eubacterium oxidoreducens]
MRTKINLNNDWEFTGEFTKEFYNGEAGAYEKVRLPHTCRELPMHYFDERDYEMISGYRRMIFANPFWKGKRLFLVIEAAGHKSEVYFNGKKLAEHQCGYTEYEVELTGMIKWEKNNLLVIKVDSREELNQPPFGYVIDYLTYGGLYREVRLELRDPVYLGDIYAIGTVQGKIDNKKGYCNLKTHTQIKHLPKNHSMEICQQLYDGDKCLATMKKDYRDMRERVEERMYSDEIYYEMNFSVGQMKLWDVDQPKRYRLETLLMYHGKVIDRVSQMVGFRKSEFRAEGYYLNGRRLKFCGLNRHQSYPYVGYAMPESMQRLDARILKEELGVNAVRTSHYPQSKYFLEECDRLGLLVFTEIPGWQHIGDEAWKRQAMENVQDMIVQYRNHPSIIIWGVRINESADDDEFYTMTNKIAHALDETRPTSGVRYLKKSHLLEDVYAYNDFSYDGTGNGCEPKKKVTSQEDKPYIISEYNGHMYPTKSFDNEKHRQEHALRHAKVLNDIAIQEGVAGSFGWCMSDYNTHSDFGSGDNVCYHGVMDMFRNAKMAAAVYASQSENAPVLEVTSAFDIGENPAGNRGRIFILTNAQKVRMYKNDVLIRTYQAQSEEYPYMLHPPIEVDDFIGNQIEIGEDFEPKQAMLVKEILNYGARFGYQHLPIRLLLKGAWLLLRYRMNFQQAYALYGKYIGDWGKKGSSFKFEAVYENQVVKTVTKGPANSIKLEAVADHVLLKEKTTYDVALVRIKMVDQNGNILPYYNEPVTVRTKGMLQIIGPKTFSLQGGMGGVFLKTQGISSDAEVTISANGAETVKISFRIEAE